jgi:signal peptidase II
MHRHKKKKSSSRSISFTDLVSKRTSFVIAFIVIFILDILTKQIVRLSGLRTENGIVDIVYVINTGSLWSLFASSSYSNVLFIMLALIAMGVVMRYVLSSDITKQEVLPFGILAAGIAGNFVDRLFFGGVIDWINLYWWPIFNIADSAIVIGVFWLVVLSLFEKKK